MPNWFWILWTLAMQRWLSDTPKAFIETGDTIFDFTPGNSIIIAGNTSLLALYGGGTRTITMPIAPAPGQMIHITLGAAHTGMTIAANTGHTIIDGTMPLTLGATKSWRFTSFLIWVPV